MQSVIRRVPRLLPFVALAVAGALALPQPAAAQAVPEAPLTQIRINDTSLGLRGGVPSPDGRWLILERSEGTGHRSLWLLPAAGGELIRLTDGGYADAAPAWSPAGDRVFFTSNRPARGELGPGGARGGFVMALRIDPQTGRPVDAPRQVTLERNSERPTVSPDGRSVLYRTENELRVVPAMGGNSRVIGTLPTQSGLLTWAQDGNAVYYAGRDPATNEAALYRVATSGGTPTEIMRGRRIAGIAPAAQRLAVISPGPGTRQQTIEVIDFSGRTIARRVTDSSLQPVGFSADGGTLILRASDVAAIVRVRPVAGGEAIDLTDGSTYNWPAAWTADSRSLIVLGDMDGARIVPVAGGTPRTVKLTEEEVRAGARMDDATSTHVSFRMPNDQERHRLVSIDIATGARTVLTENSWIGYGTRGMTGPGGVYRDIDGLYFTELVDGSVVFKSAAPGRPTRSIHSTPLQSAREVSHASQGDRLAYYGMVGDSAAVMIIDGQGAAPRVLATLGAPYNPRACCGALSFSHDGSWVVAAPDASTVTFIRVPRQGRATEVRNVPVDAEYWYEPRWLPDNSGITAIVGAGDKGWVAFVPTAPGRAVRHISKSDDHSAWLFTGVSPDGRYVAYPAEVPRGMTLWRMEIR
jgi:Tol biopolymer transport system component